MLNHKGRILFFSHGGGPMPLLGDPGHGEMISFLKEFVVQHPKPEAIVVISAHWEERVATLTGALNPHLLFDYYGFPSESYAYTYPVAGQPELAHKIKAMLEARLISATIDDEKGLDHGVFVPLMLMYPEADIPVVQLSLLRGLDASAHVALGRGLNELLSENILILGSGFSYHNLRAFMQPTESGIDLGNEAFQNWLKALCTEPMDQTQRERKLIAWEEGPSARYCHPREEHLLPLHVCMGAAGRGGKAVFDGAILGKRCLGIYWE